MASDINNVTLIGRLTRDPELSVLKQGTSIAKFSLANNRSFSTGGEKKDQTSFFNCVAWGKLGEIIAEYAKKGHRIAICGRLQQRTWEDDSGAKKSVVEIVVENCQFLEGRKDGTDHHDDGVKRGPGVPDDVPKFADAHPVDDNPFGNDDDIPL